MWEYKFLVFELSEENSIDESEAALNNEGAQGWEAVAVLPKMGAGESWCYALLKRQKAKAA